MDKNWLIRTKTNHILGPISKEKVLELFHNNSIKPDDEICSGNGFWFFIREDDMVKRFLLGSEVQGFNPVSEAKDVLTSGVKNMNQETSQDDVTLVNGLHINLVQSGPLDPVPTSPETTSKAHPTDLKKKITEAPKTLKKQNYFQYLGILGFVVLFLLLYFRKNIIRSLFNGEMTVRINLIDQARAQDEDLLKKKSS
jgi:hypothetical protein